MSGGSVKYRDEGRGITRSAQSAAAEGRGHPSARASRPVLDGKGRQPRLPLREGSLPDGRDYRLGDPGGFPGSRARPAATPGTSECGKQI
jgi:hypothetical protein